MSLESKAVRLQKSVRVALLRAARLAATVNLSPAQKHALSLLRQELLRADIRAEVMPREFVQELPSPIILGV